MAYNGHPFVTLEPPNQPTIDWDLPIFLTSLHGQQKLKRAAEWDLPDAEAIRNDPLNITHLSNGCTQGFLVKTLEARTVQLAFHGQMKDPRSVQAGPFDLQSPLQPHHFINTGSGAVNDLAMCPFSETNCVLTVAKTSSRGVSGDGEIQFWSVPLGNFEDKCKSHRLKSEGSAKRRRKTVSSGTPRSCSSEDRTPQTVERRDSSEDDLESPTLLCSYRCETAVTACNYVKGDVHPPLLMTIDSLGNLRIMRVALEGETLPEVQLTVIYDRLAVSGGHSATDTPRFVCCAAEKMSAGIGHPNRELLAVCGTTQGTIVEMVLDYQAADERIVEVGLNAVSVSNVPVTAITLLPGTEGSFAAVGTAAGNVAVCDLRRENCKMTEVEYTSRPINAVVGCSIPGYIIAAQNAAIVLSLGYMESSHHTASKLWHPDVKTRTKKADDVWSSILIPPHRQRALIKSLDHVNTSCSSAFDQALWTSDDGCCFLGNVRDLDHKSYATAGVFTWSLVNPVSVSAAMVLQSGDDMSEKEVLKAAQVNMKRRFDMGVESVKKDGLHILGGHFYHLAQFLADNVGSSHQTKEEKVVLPSAYVVRLMSSCAFEGKKYDLVAYSGALGIVHVLPTIVFDRVCV